MIACATLKQQINAVPKTWLITGVAGFIGSNLLEALLKHNQRVVTLIISVLAISTIWKKYEVLSALSSGQNSS